MNYLNYMKIILLVVIIVLIYFCFSKNCRVLVVRNVIREKFFRIYFKSFIHKKAIRNYKEQLNMLIEGYSKIDKEELADYFIMSVWTRAGMQIEGHFRYPDGQIDISPTLSAWHWGTFEKIVNNFKRMGLYPEATAMSIWVHAARGILYEPKMQEEYNKFWQLLMSTNSLWDKYLNKFYEEDKNKLNSKMLNNTMALAKEILNNFPPKKIHTQNTSYLRSQKQEGVKSKINHDKMVDINVVCPRCGQKNPPGTFRCKNEDCLEILPQKD